MKTLLESKRQAVNQLTALVSKLEKATNTGTSNNQEESCNPLIIDSILCFTELCVKDVQCKRHLMHSEDSSVDCVRRLVRLAQGCGGSGKGDREQGARIVYCLVELCLMRQEGVTEGGSPGKNRKHGNESGRFEDMTVMDIPYELPPMFKGTKQIQGQQEKEKQSSKGDLVFVTPQYRCDEMGTGDRGFLKGTTVVSTGRMDMSGEETVSFEADEYAELRLFLEPPEAATGMSKDGVTGVDDINVGMCSVVFGKKVGLLGGVAEVLKGLFEGCREVWGTIKKEKGSKKLHWKALRGLLYYGRAHLELILVFLYSSIFWEHKKREKEKVELNKSVLISVIEKGLTKFMTYQGDLLSCLHSEPISEVSEKERQKILLNLSLLHFRMLEVYNLFPAPTLEKKIGFFVQILQSDSSKLQSERHGNFPSMSFLLIRLMKLYDSFLALVKAATRSNGAQVFGRNDAGSLSSSYPYMLDHEKSSALIKEIESLECVGINRSFEEDALHLINHYYNITDNARIYELLNVLASNFCCVHKAVDSKSNQEHRIFFQGVLREFIGENFFSEGFFDNAKDSSPADCKLTSSHALLYQFFKILSNYISLNSRPTPTQLKYSSAIIKLFMILYTFGNNCLQDVQRQNGYIGAEMYARFSLLVLSRYLSQARNMANIRGFYEMSDQLTEILRNKDEQKLLTSTNLDNVYGLVQQVNILVAELLLNIDCILFSRVKDQEQLDLGVYVVTYWDSEGRKPWKRLQSSTSSELIQMGAQERQFGETTLNFWEKNSLCLLEEIEASFALGMFQTIRKAESEDKTENSRSRSQVWLRFLKKLLVAMNENPIGVIRGSLEAEMVSASSHTKQAFLSMGQAPPPPPNLSDMERSKEVNFRKSILLQNRDAKTLPSSHPLRFRKVLAHISLEEKLPGTQEEVGEDDNAVDSSQPRQQRSSSVCSGDFLFETKG
eukprot:Nk52_evm6s373 gene=Nk52_evmTU6s373